MRLGARGFFFALLRPHTGRLVLGGCCLVLLAAATACYAYLVGPVLQLVLTGGARGASYVPLPALHELSQTSLLVAVAVLIGVLALIKGVANLGQALLLEGTAERIGHHLRVRTYAQMIRQPLSWHRREGLGGLLTRILDDVRRVQDAAVVAPICLVREALAAAALCAVAIWMAPWLTLAAALALPLSGVTIGLVSRAVKRASRQHQDGLEALADRAAGALGAIREVKSSGAEEREVEAVSAHGHGALCWARRRIALRATSPLINELMAAAALGGALVYAGGQIAAGTLQPERFVSFFAALLMMYRPIKALGQAASMIATGAASVDRVGRVFQGVGEEPPEQAFRPLRERLVLSDICFCYGDDAQRALDGVDLELRVGEAVALAGPSGAGKSTLASIVCGLERPSAGTLSWDGADITSRPLAELRAQVALVPQQPLIIGGATLAENLRYGAPSASGEQLRQALEAVGLAESLGGDLNLCLGPPDGRGLSVGEAQRLAVARALLRSVRLVVLDEPSSALDPESEERLLDLLDQLRQSSAVLVVAHGSRVLARMDRIVRLEEGRLAPDDGGERVQHSCTPPATVFAETPDVGEKVWPAV
jgi:subfamily B ATP-binding cassette protein MsbA